MQEPREKRKTVGQRSRKLDKAFHSTVKYALRGSPIDEFETYFPPDSLSQGALSAAYDAYSQVRFSSTRILFTPEGSLTLPILRSAYIKRGYLSIENSRKFARKPILRISCRLSTSCVQSKVLTVQETPGMLDLNCGRIDDIYSHDLCCYTVRALVRDLR